MLSPCLTHQGVSLAEETELIRILVVYQQSGDGKEGSEVEVD